MIYDKGLFLYYLDKLSGNSTKNVVLKLNDPSRVSWLILETLLAEKVISYGLINKLSVGVGSYVIKNIFSLINYKDCSNID